MKPVFQPLITNLLRWAAPILFLTIFVLFIAASNRGFDLSDESYYLLNYLNWRELSATSTFFGAYIELPFRIMGKSLAAIRIFGLILLCVGSAIFLHGLAKLYRQKTGDEITDYRTNLIAAMSVSFLYYGFYFTLRAPSYNLISLFCILSASGTLFYVMSEKTNQFRQVLASTFYGLLLSILFFTKATSAAALVLIHLAYFLVHGGLSTRFFLLKILPAAVLGAGINVALLTTAAPHWLDSLIAGVALANTMDQRDQLVLTSLFVLGRDLLKDISTNWHYYAGALGITAAVFLLPSPKRKLVGGWWLLGLITGAVFMFITKRPIATWVMISTSLYLALWCADYLSRESRLLTRNDHFKFTLWIFLIFATLAFSIGTGVPLVRHSAISIVLPFVGILLMLNRLHLGQVLSVLQHRLALIMFCVIALAFQVMPWAHAKYTYRLRTALSAQNQPVTVPGAAGAMLVDKQTAAELDAFADMLKLAGFKRDMNIMDLTGDSPGLVYLAGGKPVGVAWILGGYAGSTATLHRIVQLVGTERVKCSWLLTSDDSHRHIADWRGTLDGDAGAFDHQRVGEFVYTPGYAWGDVSRISSTIVLWRPRGSKCSA